MKTFNFKLFIYLPLILLLAIALLLFAVYKQAANLEKGYFETIRNDLAARDFLMSETVAGYIRKGELDNLRAYCRKISGKMDTRVTVIDDKGKILADSENDPHFMENHLERPEVASALDGKAAGATRYSSTLGTYMSYYAMPLAVDGKTYCIRTAVGAARLGVLLKQAFRTILLAGIIGALVAAGLAFYLFRLITHPLDELRRAADRVAQGDYDVSLPVPDNGEVRSLAIALNSMSEELKAKLAKITREKNERDAILSSMTEGVILVKGNGIIKRWNKAAEAMFNFSADGNRLSFAAIVGSRELIKLTEDAKNADGIFESELTLNMPDGERSFISRAGRLYLGEKRKPGVLLVITDITVIRRLEEFRRDFIADVTHEIKTPLTSIIAAVETLESVGDDKEAQSRFMKIITQQATRLNALVQDILSLSNLEHKRLSSSDEMPEISVEGAVREAVELCRPRAEAKNIRLNLEVADNVMIHADAQLLEQAVINLIDNAIKYSNENSEVKVTMKRSGGNLFRIDVLDHGIGIAKEHQERVFERFYRVDKARSRKLGGTGLGLAIVKHVALLHGGKPGVVSEPGKGSDFYIQLPLENRKAE